MKYWTVGIRVVMELRVTHARTNTGMHVIVKRPVVYINREVQAAEEHIVS